MTLSASDKLVFFAHNRRDTAFVRRVGAFLRAGIQVTTFTFRRDGEPAEPGPDWPNIDLGHLEHARFVRRALVYLRTLLTIVRERRHIAAADIVYARNLDIFLLAWLARRLASWRPRSVLVYECLDVHEALIGSSLRARILRFVERRVLAASRLLVVSSPGFVREFFSPLQGYRGPVHWIENKLFLDETPVDRPQPSTAPEKSDNSRSDNARSNNARSDTREPVITLGWVGIIRCTKTLDLLVALADRFGPRLNIRISGLVSYFLIADFDERIAEHDNIVFTGKYAWPDGLANVYGALDLVWSQELTWSGGNSDWLIPNRIYEASYFGVPSLAVTGTQTATTILERDLGYALADAGVDTAAAFIESLTRDQLNDHRDRLLSRPASDFVLQASDTDALLAAIRASGNGPTA